MKKSTFFQKNLALIWLVTCSLISSIGISQTINIPADFATIQEGINAAVDGDTVLVAPGTYVENINFSGKAVHLLSVEGPGVTVIDGNQEGSTVSFISGEGQGSIIDGFTITNGSGTFDATIMEFVGGGVYMLGNVSPIIQNNVISENLTFLGGGIGLSNTTAQGSPSILNNVITNNDDGGIYLQRASSFVITGNVVSNNIEKGIDVRLMNSGLIQNNEVVANTDDGIYTFFGASVNVFDNLSDSNGGDGIYQRMVNSSVINGNTSTNNAEDGIYVFDVSIRTEIIGNTVADNTDTGVYVRTAEEILIQDNSITNSGRDGIYSWMIEDLNIINNLVSVSVDNSVYLRDDTLVTFFNNTCLGGEKGIRVRGSEDVTMGNSIIRGQDQDAIFLQFDVTPPTILYSNIEGGYAGDGNIDADPLFADAANGDFKLLSGSPSIDAGDNNLMPADITEDLAGLPRFTDDVDTPDTGVGNGPIVDMGPYELFVEPILGIDETSTIAISLFPNPTTNILNLQTDSFISNIEIYDMNGRLVLDQDPDANEAKINVEALQSGLYIIEINTTEGADSRRFVKQ